MADNALRPARSMGALRVHEDTREQCICGCLRDGAAVVVGPLPVLVSGTRRAAVGLHNGDPFGRRTEARLHMHTGGK